MAVVRSVDVDEDKASEVMSLRVKPETKRGLQELAAAAGVPVHEIVRRAVQALESEESYRRLRSAYAEWVRIRDDPALRVALSEPETRDRAEPTKTRGEPAEVAGSVEQSEPGGVSKLGPRNSVIEPVTSDQG